MRYLDPGEMRFGSQATGTVTVALPAINRREQRAARSASFFPVDLSRLAAPHRLRVQIWFKLEVISFSRDLPDLQMGGKGSQKFVLFARAGFLSVSLQIPTKREFLHHFDKHSNACRDFL